MTDRPTGARWLLRLLSCIRFDEVLVLQGAPLLGAVFAASQFTGRSPAPLLLLLLLVAGNALLVAHVFLLNDWSGVQEDLRDPARSAGVFLNRGIHQGEIGALLLALLLASLVLFGQLGWTTLVIGLAIAAASALYSLPHVYMKGMPLANTALHLVSGLLHFLLGYSIFHGLDARGVEIGFFFATIFCAGHLTQEVRDFDADLHNGIHTNAVRFGAKRCLIASFALFTLANALLVALALRESVPRAIGLVAALYPLHLYWTLRTLREGLTFASVRRLQGRYRVLYAGIGVAMVVSVLTT
jgi:4-hydroxybenzoate polyprenyltransferase